MGYNPKGHKGSDRTELLSTFQGLQGGQRAWGRGVSRGWVMGVSGPRDPSVVLRQGSPATFQFWLLVPQGQV